MVLVEDTSAVVISSDYMLSHIPEEEFAKFSGVLEAWIHNPQCDPTVAASTIVGDLQAKMACWPPANDPGLKRKLADESTLKTKGVVTGFNFYSKTTRDAVLQEYGHQLLNNELNKVLGERWKKLSRNEKEPFMIMAEQDKKRYKEEKTEKTSGVSSSATSLSGESKTQDSNKKTKFGKHGGDRWAAMAVGEKNLYLVIHEVDAAECAEIV
eukprot:gene31807-39290_t